MDEKYPNLIRGLIPTVSNQLWVSDITYWKTKAGIYYISLITDVFSHKIVGYNLADSMEAVESLMALKMALKENKSIQNLIHHSDRGSQYCSFKYVNLLQDYNIQISMTESGDPLENAVAERENGILKEEYLDHYEIDNLKDAKELLASVVSLYNNERPHMSIGKITPSKVHSGEIQKGNQKWKNYYSKTTQKIEDNI